MALVLGSACALGQSANADAACGARDASFTLTRDKTQHPTPMPRDGGAVLYVFGSNRFPGWGFEGTLAVDGSWVGAVSHSGDYFVLPIEAGEHHLCARVSSRTGPFLTPAFKLESTTQYFRKASPGAIYYLDLRVGRRTAGGLVLLDSDRGRRWLATATFTTTQIQ